MERATRKTLLGLRASALLEMILALALLLAFDFFFGQQNRFWNANPHPFWFVVLLVAAQYGTKEAIIAAILSSLALLIGNMPEQIITQDSYAYLLYVIKLPLMWGVAAVIFGELRQMHIRERDKLEENYDDAVERESRVAQSYQWVKGLKERLELRVAGQLRSSIAAYHAAKSMEALTPAEVITGLEELVNSTLHPEQFSIYSLTNRGLEVTLTSGWKEKDSYAKQFITSDPLYQAVVTSSAPLTVSNADQERLLAGQAVLASPIIDRESGEVLGMLKIEKLGFTDLNLSTVETLNAICEWAGMSMVNARKYQAAKDGSIINPDHNLFSFNYFNRFTNYISSLAKRLSFDVSVIVVRIANAGNLDEATRSKVAKALAESVDQVLRNVDLAFDYSTHSEEYSLVLPATNVQGAQIVLDKIRGDLLKRAGAVSSKADFSFTIQALYERQ